MQRWLIVVSLFVAGLAIECNWSIAAEPLTVASDFEGASVRDVEIDAATRSISFMPGGDPVRGWPCWWYFRVNGITPGETITLRLRGSTATVPKPGAPPQKPLASSWAMPAQATFSNDGQTWLHTEKGQRQDEWMIYTLKPESASVFVAWGPPYTPSTAAKFVRAMSEKSPHAKATELCRSRGGRAVPMLHVQEGERTKEQRFGVWVQARQHAWESGSSWVAQGFAEWLLSDAADAAWLRQHAEIFLVPIMDVDNTATGNGGKDAQPQDHNRDWSAQPHWNEIIAAQRMVSGLIEEGRMDVFLDLHNPAPDDPTFFYVLSPELLKEPMIGLRDRFVELAYARISKIKPLIPMSNKPKVTGANYHPLWRQISANWVSMNGNPHTVSLCLETIWNYPNSTTEGYRAVGANLAAAVREYLAEHSAKPNPPTLLIGYNEHRTNLPGGRQANVSTNRAMLVKADGSERRPLAADLANEPGVSTQFAAWSPDGKTAVIGRGWQSPENAKWEEEHKTFRFTPEGWLYDSYLVDVATGKAENVTAIERVSFYNSGLFFWPNDPKKLGFTALINGNSKPFRMDRDGRNKVDLTKNSNGFAYGFSSSRDGSRISYHENYQVYLADADGSHRVQVQTGHPFNFAPAWSPDGQWVLFVSGEHYNCHPHIVRADGTGLKKLADRAGYRGVTEFLDVPDFHGGSSDTPIWSADGASVFYTAKVGNNVELFRVTLAGVTEQLTKTAEGTLHYHPKPSPDGHWIVYGSKRNGVRNLYLMRLSDCAEYPLTDLPVGHAAMHAYWQPAATPD